MPNKAVAAGGSAGVTGAVATLIIALWWPNADATTAAALTTVITALLGALGAFLAKYEGA